MEIMEIVGFTNNFQNFCYQIHGNYWFQGRKHSKNLGQWGGTIYIYIYVYIKTGTRFPLRTSGRTYLVEISEHLAICAADIFASFFVEMRLLVLQRYEGGGGSR